MALPGEGEMAEINVPYEFYDGLCIPEGWSLFVLAHQMRMWVNSQMGLAVKTMFEEDEDGSRWVSFIIESRDGKPTLYQLHYIQKYWVGNRTCVISRGEKRPPEQANVTHMTCCLDRHTSGTLVRATMPVPNDIELIILHPESVS